MSVLHVVSISKEAYNEIKSALPPASRFVNVEQWGFAHFWLYDPAGEVLIFTAEPIEKYLNVKVEGIPGPLPGKQGR